MTWSVSPGAPLGRPNGILSGMWILLCTSLPLICSAHSGCTPTEAPLAVGLSQAGPSESASLEAAPRNGASTHPAPTQPGASTDDLRAVWEQLDADRRRDVIEYLRLDLSHAESFQLGLVRYVISASGIEPGLWEAAPEATWFDPQVHAPAQPIARKLLAPDGKKAERARGKFLSKQRPRLLRAAWSYDWARGEVVWHPDRDDHTRLFENALAGFAPDHDLAEALVLRALDDGSQALPLAAFAHLYTDRSGNAYPGITLYDAWNSGEGMEMPDVDVLGVVHEVLDDWKTWVAPVPDRKHAALYGKVGELFLAAKRHRELRESLASAYLCAEPVYPGRFTRSDDLRFQAFWEFHSSALETAGEDLPGATEKARDDWLKDQFKRLGKDEDLLARTHGRDQALTESQTLVQRRLRAVMADLKLLD